MNQYIIGSTIRKLREKNKLTQSELATKLSVTDKSISKWETGKGYPDITLIEDIAKVFNVSITELFSGETVDNTNISSNMEKTKFYVCPICGNVITSTGELAVSCHGIVLSPIECEECDENHKLNLEKVEDEYYISINHEMTKKHYISFIAVVTNSTLQLKKLYPEENAGARFKIGAVRRIYFYCNKDGLYTYNLK